MVEILIETATNLEVERFTSPPKKVSVPGTKSDTVYPGDDPRPMAIGPLHFLSVATVVDPGLGVNQRYGEDLIGVDNQSVTITKVMENLPVEEVAAKDKSAREQEFHGGGLSMGHILMELVSELVKKGVMSVNDFDPRTKKMYMNMKKNSDKLKEV